MQVQTETKSALTLRAAIIGAVGSAVLTASSMFIALKMGALPWPIVFAALASFVILRVFGSKDLHEVNVCHAAMSAGSMVAGGLAFTIPGLWMLGSEYQVTLPQVLIASLGGTLVGLVVCAVLQPYFIRKHKLAFPVGLSAAQTLKATANTEAAEAKTLFGGMGFAAIYAIVRDVLKLMPYRLLSFIEIPGITFGIQNSPMMVAMGFTLGVVPVLVWFGGAVFGLALLMIAPAAGWCTVEVASAIRQSLGLGLMLGVGAGVIVKGLIPVAKRAFGAKTDATEASLEELDADEMAHRLSVERTPAALVCAAVVCVAAFVLNLGLLPSVLLVAGAWFSVYLSGWLTGTTGIDPMEIFGVLVLLLIQLLFHNVSTESLFLAAAFVAVACGVGGDVMNDLKAGDELGTNPRDQFFGMAIGGIVGAVVGSLLIMGICTAYGPESFGGDGEFIAAQASVVATMAGGIPHVPAFVVGLVGGCVVALLGLPAMTLGLGVYLPFYMSAGAVIGAVVKIVWDRLHKDDSAEELAAGNARGMALASGILGGESLVGVITAIITMIGIVTG